jgi:hypothetical protein
MARDDLEHFGDVQRGNIEVASRVIAVPGTLALGCGNSDFNAGIKLEITCVSSRCGWIQTCVTTECVIDAYLALQDT